MHFGRADFNDDLASLRADRRPALRAVGDNFAFEENVGPDRLADFEAFNPTNPNLRATAGEYFWELVQGVERTHTPSTFRPVNRSALLPGDIEPAQKIIRIERVDEALNKLPWLNFEQLEAALDPDHIDYRTASARP